MARALINLPAKVKRGEVFEIKTLVQHPMDTGYLRDNDGNPVPRNIIKRFTCTYNGEEVFAADMSQAVAANPFIAFTTVATESGIIAFTWLDDREELIAESVKITVE